MKNNSEENFKVWFAKAQEDEFAGVQILNAKKFPAPACFHFQQMAEKYLKGLLIFHGKDFPKIHDLFELETLLLDFEPGIKSLHKDLEALNRYYIETRYPGDYPEFTLKDAKEALDAAEKIKKFVLAKIKKAGSGRV